MPGKGQRKAKKDMAGNVAAFSCHDADLLRPADLICQAERAREERAAEVAAKPWNFPCPPPELFDDEIEPVDPDDVLAAIVDHVMALAPHDRLEVIDRARSILSFSVAEHQARGVGENRYYWDMREPQLRAGPWPRR